jgi:hypothetical protein
MGWINQAAANNNVKCQGAISSASHVWVCNSQAAPPITRYRIVLEGLARLLGFGMTPARSVNERSA